MKLFSPFSRNHQKSNVWLFTAFILTALMLFICLTLLVLSPLYENTIKDVQDEVDKTTVKVFAAQLEQYLLDRELALRDLSTNPLVVNVSLLGNGDRPDFHDFINQVRLLGEDPVITVLDVVGGVLYSELESTAQYSDLYQLAWSTLDSNEGVSPSDYQAYLMISNAAVQEFILAVPTVYGARVHGLVIAHFSAAPDTLFEKNSKLGSEQVISYGKAGQYISSDAEHLKVKHYEHYTISRYGIDFTLISDRDSILQNAKAIKQRFLSLTAICSVLIFIFLFFLGRKIIVAPYQALVASQQAISSAVEGIAYIDVHGQCVSLNEAYAELTGYSVTELEGSDWSQIVYPEDISLIEKAYLEMKANGKVVAEVRGITKQAEFFYMRVTLVARYDDSERFAGHYCFIQNISTQKIADEQIRSQQRELQLIFDSVPVRIWYKDDKNRILRLNKQAANSMGGEVADFEGKDTYDLFPDMAKKYHEDDLAVIRSAQSQLGIIEKYAPENQPHGWVSTHKIPYVDPITGNAFLFVCALDITAMKKAEEDNIRLISQLSHSNKELEQFAYIASHDLKSPLRGIEQLAHWVQQDCSEILPAKSNTHLGLMINRVNRMESLLKDLLEFSRMGRMDLSTESVNFNEILVNLCDLLIEPFGFKYALDVPDENIDIPRKAFEIVIRNLINNSVKHHDKESGLISISYRSDDDSHFIEVSDDGPGIDPKMHDKVFQVFQTLQPRDKVEGSGMGLAIVKKILSRYEGRIDIDSDGVNGTIFKIIWPREAID